MYFKKLNAPGKLWEKGTFHALNNFNSKTEKVYVYFFKKYLNVDFLFL